MESPSSFESARERAARLLTEAMRRDVEAQQPLIEARAEGRTEAVYWDSTSYEAERERLLQEDRRIRNEVQLAMIRVHLAIEEAREVVSCSRELIAVGQSRRATISATFHG